MRRKTTKGDVMNWDKSNFELVNMTIEERTMESICVPPRPGHVLLPERRNFSSHQAICSKFRGLVSVVRDQETQDKMVDELYKYPACGDPNEGLKRIRFLDIFECLIP